MCEEPEIEMPRDAGRVAWDVPIGSGDPQMTVDLVTPSPVLRQGERGALIFPRVYRISPNPASNATMNMIYVGDFDPEAVAVGLLLFDRLDHPINTMLSPEPGVPAGLESWSGFARSAVSCGGAMNFGMFSEIAYAAFTALDEREEGRWANVRTEGGVHLPSKWLNARAAFQIKLIDALPIPRREVPYDEVLSFKDRRKDELQALRHYLDDLALEVARDNFSGFAENVIFERFQAALADHAKATKESKFPKRIANLAVSSAAQLGKTGVGKGVGMLVEQTIGLPGVSAAIGDAVGAAMSISGERKTKVDNQQPAPFDYLVKAGREI